MQEFDLKTFKKKTDKLITRDGKSVRIICTDRICGDHAGPLVALVKNKSGTFEQLVQYDKNGRQINYDRSYRAREYDLFIDD